MKHTYCDACKEIADNRINFQNYILCEKCSKTLLTIADISILDLEQKIRRLEEINRDLLEACKSLLTLETRYTNISLKEFDMARKAILKAEGKE